MSRARRWAVGVLFLCGLSCAQIAPPSGGPEDKEPPRVTATFPDSGLVSVPPGDSVALVFSESMDRRTVENSFFLSPPVEYRSRRWENMTWILRLKEPFRPDRTYVGLLGTGAKDRHALAQRAPWMFAFSTGDSLDTGIIKGKVVGQRYSPKDAFIYVWPWSEAPPDTTVEGFPPDPIRLGQADSQGSYSLEFLPRGRPLRICALYDQERDQQFDPGRDQWACFEEAVTVSDTASVVTGVDLYLTYPDEPGTVSGTVVDSTCVRSDYKRELDRVRAERDSLREWLDAGGTGEEGEGEGQGQGQGQAEGEGGEQRPGRGAERLTLEDSLRVGRLMLRLDSLETAAHADSAYCVKLIYVRLLSDTTMVREAKADPKYSWSDVPPGIYRLMAFRDLNDDGKPDSTEPAARSEFPLEVRPLHVLEDMDLVLRVLGDVRGGRP